MTLATSLLLESVNQKAPSSPMVIANGWLPPRIGTLLSGIVWAATPPAEKASSARQRANFDASVRRQAVNTPQTESVELKLIVMSGNCTARLNRQTGIGVAVVTFSRKMPGQFPRVNDQTGVFQGFGRHFRENFLYDCFADFYIFRDLGGESHASSCRCRMKSRCRMK